MGRSLLILALVLGSACACTTPIPVASPNPDASVAAATCANLAHLGCAIGSDPRCAGRLELAVSENHTTAADIACARTATSVPALNASCGDYFGCGP